MRDRDDPSGRSTEEIRLAWIIEEIRRTVADYDDGDRMALIPPSNRRPDGPWCTAAVGSLRELLAAAERGGAARLADATVRRRVRGLSRRLAVATALGAAAVAAGGFFEASGCLGPVATARLASWFALAGALAVASAKAGADSG